MSTCNGLDLQTLGSQPMIMPKNLPDHWFTCNLSHAHMLASLHKVINIRQWGEEIPGFVASM